MFATLIAVSILTQSQVYAINELCGQYETFYQYPYIWNNNAWNKDDSGFSCTYVPEQPNTSSNAWYALWRWPSDPAVRGYPNIGFQSTILPLQLQNLRHMNVSASWSLRPADSSHNSLDVMNAQADVALDIFADEDLEKSTQPGQQKYEIMVWYAQFGNSSVPIGEPVTVGHKKRPIVAVIGNASFKLYHGENHNGQTVYTWLADRTMTAIDMDCAPLIGVLSDRKLIPESVYLGTMQWGIEPSFADINMNFTVSSFEAAIRTSNSSTDNIGAVFPESPITGMDELPVATLSSEARPSRLAISSSALFAVVGVMILALC